MLSVAPTHMVRDCPYCGADAAPTMEGDVVTMWECEDGDVWTEFDERELEKMADDPDVDVSRFVVETTRGEGHPLDLGNLFKNEE